MEYHTIWLNWVLTKFHRLNARSFKENFLMQGKIITVQIYFVLLYRHLDTISVLYIQNARKNHDSVPAGASF